MLKHNAAVVLVLLFVGILIPVAGDAANITATSAQKAHVQAAIDLALTGDTVIVPPGNVTWTTSVSVPTSKKIMLSGAGITGTIITMNPAGTAVNLGQSGSRITGFSFTNGTVVTDGEGWRVDHCKFSGDGSDIEGVLVRGDRENDPPEGVVDHCEFINKRVLAFGWMGLLAHGLWALPLYLGTGNNAVYIEDCSFMFTAFGNVCDANYGGSYVFRHNTVTDCYIECHSVQSENRAARRWEIYNNTFNQVNRAMWMPMYLRGGTGVVFNNTLTGTWTWDGIALDNVRSFRTLGFPPGNCDGTSPWDENTLGQAGWRGRDQIGCGGDDSLWTAGNPYPHQSHVPAYFWNNKHGANDVVPIIVEGCDAWIQANRDYYVGTAKPGYTPYAYPHPLIQAWDAGTVPGSGVQPPQRLRIQN